MYLKDLCFEQIKGNIKILIREREKERVREVQSAENKIWSLRIPNRANRHMQNIPPNNSNKMYILLQHAGNIFQARTPATSQNKSYEVLEDTKTT